MTYLVSDQVTIWSLDNVTSAGQLLGAMFLLLYSTWSHAVVLNGRCDHVLPLLCEPVAVGAPGSVRFDNRVATGLPKINSAGDGNLLSMGSLLFLARLYVDHLHSSVSFL